MSVLSNVDKRRSAVARRKDAAAATAARGCGGDCGRRQGRRGIVFRRPRAASLRRARPPLDGRPIDRTSRRPTAASGGRGPAPSTASRADARLAAGSRARVVRRPRRARVRFARPCPPRVARTSPPDVLTRPVFRACPAAVLPVYGRQDFPRDARTRKTLRLNDAGHTASASRQGHGRIFQDFEL